MTNDLAVQRVCHVIHAAAVAMATGELFKSMSVT